MKKTTAFVMCLVLNLLSFNTWAQNATKLIMQDTRNTNLQPGGYQKGVFSDFKRNDSINAPIGGVYGSLLTIAPWVDASGGANHQLLFNSLGIHYRQGVPGQTSWGTWHKLVLQNSSGNVGIGTTSIPTGYKLAIAGKVIAEEMKIKLQSAGWPDYVFKPSYNLMPLKKVAQFISDNGHLPEVPSAKDIEKEGIAVGSNQALLLKKIEELTLYIIEQDKKLEKLSAEVESIRNEKKNK